MGVSLTFGEYKATAKAFVRYRGGVNYLSDNAMSENGFFNHALREFTARTLCLFSQGIELTLTDDTGLYDYRAVTFVPARDFVEVNNVWIQDSGGRRYALYNPVTNMPGRMSLGDFYAVFPSYQDETKGTPVVWVAMAPHSLYLHPKPNATTIPKILVSGWFFHGELSGENDALVLGEEDHRTVAVYAAAQLMEPSSGADLLEAMASISRSSAERMKELLARAERLRNPSLTHGLFNSGVYSLG